MITTQNPTPENHCSDLQQHHTCAITQTICRIKIAKQHERTTWLESKMCQMKTRGIKGVEKLDRVCVCTVSVTLVYTHMDGLLSREPRYNIINEDIECALIRHTY